MGVPTNAFSPPIIALGESGSLRSGKRRASSIRTSVQGSSARFVRDDGTKQWAYDDKPLYTFINDKKAGDTTGDGMKDVWHTAKP
ncbi:COG4315 family predicted lipoprotein [Myxococcus landrumensis]|uniref:Lipoprotein n=1 Tax=Myxococcus landrumensis TaxID=2813577 RepID=A0ABX7N700_9BACT|nr:hypothetical protein [Myxococcus landrumus]QSQ14531.1 hypothetical protein JY572_00065 [Myxococcus landrumus]